MKKKANKAWSGRFKSETASIMDKFNSSLEFDRRLYKYDIEGSIAHAKMLAEIKILTKKELSAVIHGLNEIEKEITNGKFKFLTTDEDIHMAIERRLTEMQGEIGQKLHTARSRNDQINIDMRLYIRKEISNIQKLVTQLLKALINKAEQNKKTILPGFTHFQSAQPITLAYYYVSYFFQLKRDTERLQDTLKRVNICTLGSGAFAGVNYETKRDTLARELDMPAVSDNAMDSVADRDFIIEFISDLAILMMHLSRICEEMIIWSNSIIDFITIDDKYATGSSIMPNKKNPDACELIRGKTGRVFGNLTSLLTVMKSLPLSYNKDLQEDKEPLFDSVDTVKICLEILTKIIETLSFNPIKMKEACDKGFLQATDIADYLVGRNIPFRSAHEISGKIVLYCEKNNKLFQDLSLAEWQKFSKSFEKDIMSVLTLEKSIVQKKSDGSTSFKSVEKQLKNAQKWFKSKL